jgi:Family of unknown function (DUF6655)
MGYYRIQSLTRRFARRRTSPLAVAAIGLMLAGCTTERITEPYQSATEQLAVSTAVDRAVAKLKLVFPPGSKVYVDGRFAELLPDKDTVLPKYAVGAVRDLVLRAGGHLVDHRKVADIIVEIHNGTQSIDHRDFLIGIPSFTIPIPLTGAVTTPTLALLQRDQQQGISKLSLTTYSAHTGSLIASTNPVYGKSHATRWTVLLVFSWRKQNLIPDRRPVAASSS